MKYILFTACTLFGLFCIYSYVLAAPTYRIERTLLPETDSTYELGTSTRAWLRVFSDEFCLSGDCRTSWSSVGAAFPFTTTTNYGATVNATGTPIWFQAGLQASSTSHFVNASTTALSAGNGSVDSASIAVGNGDEGIYLAAANTLGLTNGTSGLSWNGTAFYPNSSNVRDLGVASTNVWKNLHTTFASTTQLSIGSDYLTDVNGTGLSLSAGGVLSTTLGTSVDLTTEVTGTLPVGNGGTGLTTCGSNNVVTGDGTSPLTCESQFTYNGSVVDNQITADSVQTMIRAINLSTGSSAAARINIRTDGGGDAYALFQRNLTATSWSYGIEGNDDSFRINNATTIGSADEMTFSNAGNVGIGTASDSQTGRLTIVATSTDASLSTANQLTLRSRAVAIGVSSPLIGGIGFESNDSNIPTPGVVVASIKALATGTHTAANQLTDLAFYTTDTGGTATNTEKMRITGEGYVGIGTSSPSGFLEIGNSLAGNTRQYITNTNASTNALAEFAIRNGYNNIDDSLRLITLGTGYTTSGRYIQDSAVITTGSGLSGGLGLATGAAAPIMFYTTGDERMRITSAGLVGIGTTTPPSIFTLHGSAPKQTFYDTSTSQLRTINGLIDSSFSLATTTMGTGTTTLKQSGFVDAWTLYKLGCPAPKGGGSFVIQIGDGTASTTAVLSSGALTTTFTTMASNNSFTAGEVFFVAWGSVSGTVADPSCSWQRFKQ